MHLVTLNNQSSRFRKWQLCNVECYFWNLISNYCKNGIVAKKAVVNNQHKCPSKTDGSGVLQRNNLEFRTLWNWPPFEICEVGANLLERSRRPKFYWTDTDLTQFTFFLSRESKWPESRHIEYLEWKLIKGGLNYFFIILFVFHCIFIKTIFSIQF